MSGGKLFGHVSHSTQLVRMCLACQYSDFNTAKWFSDDLHATSSWYLRTMGKESYHSFQQTLVGNECVMNPLDRLRGRLITCKTCGLQYVGSTKTQFAMRFDNHKTGIRRHENLVHVQRDQDDLIYKHFLGGGDITDWRISRYRSLTESVMRRNWETGRATGLMGESLLTSLFTFFLISIRAVAVYIN